MCIKPINPARVRSIKKRMDDYINSANYYKLFYKIDEKKLAFEIKNGDRDALEKLIKSNIYIVIQEAKRLIKKTKIEEHSYFYYESLSHAIYEGINGLIEAGELYDGSNSFRNFYLSYIRKNINTFLEESITNDNHNLI